jgi:hypothetical protein
VIHLYALADAPVAVAGLSGLDGAEVRDLHCGRLHAVVSDHDAVPAPTREHALDHAAVVEAVCALVDAVPVRFGVRHADEPALRAALDERAEALVDVLRRVGGRHELVLRATAAPEAKAPTPSTVAAADAPGRSYLEARLAEERARVTAARSARERLRSRTEELDDLAVEVLERDGPVGPERCLLVDDDRLEATLRLARRLIDAQDGLVLGGPWPPYTFAGGIG